MTKVFLIIVSIFPNLNLNTMSNTTYRSIEFVDYFTCEQAAKNVVLKKESGKEEVAAFCFTYRN